MQDLDEILQGLRDTFVLDIDPKIAEIGGNSNHRFRAELRNIAEILIAKAFYHGLSAQAGESPRTGSGKSQTHNSDNLVRFPDTPRRARPESPGDGMAVDFTVPKNYDSLLRLIQFARQHPEAPVRDALDAFLPEVAVLDAESAALDASQDALPMPTAAEIAAQGKRYSNQHRPGRPRGSRKDDLADPANDPIIRHLREVWWPWIVSGQLTRPELLARDPSAYTALGRWLAKEGNSLVDALGYDIPSRSQAARANVTPEAIREAKRLVAIDQRDRYKR